MIVLSEACIDRNCASCDDPDCGCKCHLDKVVNDWGKEFWRRTMGDDEESPEYESP